MKRQWSKFLTLILATLMVFAMAIPASAAGTTKTHDCGNDYTITVPNVTKTGFAIYSGSYYVGYDEANDEEIFKAYDPTGWEGYIFNNSVGMPVYYVSGESVTITATGFIFENGMWFKLEHEADGNFVFDAEMADPYTGWQNDSISVSGTGFAKYRINTSKYEQASGGTVTLGKGVWQAPGIQDFVPCLVVVGESANSSSTSFSDVPANAYYADAVKWAADNNITGGTSATTFSPTMNVNRAQAVTFLWRTQNCPEPKTRVSPFNDVKDTNSWYYKAVLWAVENNITNGTGANTFSPDGNVTRGQMVTFLYRTMGEPGKTGTGAWYADAEKWAKQNNLLTGTSTAYSTNGDCPRSDVVFYLWKALAKKA